MEITEQQIQWRDRNASLIIDWIIVVARRLSMVPERERAYWTEKLIALFALSDEPDPQVQHSQSTGWADLIDLARKENSLR